MSAETGHDRRENLPDTERLLTLSDGVVAIALTLLVLQLKVPSLAVVDKTSAARLASALADETSQFVSYVISFYVIAQSWVSTSAAKYIWILIAIAPWLARRWLARHGQVAQEPPAGQA